MVTPAPKYEESLAFGMSKLYSEYAQLVIPGLVSQIKVGDLRNSSDEDVQEFAYKTRRLVHAFVLEHIKLVNEYRKLDDNYESANS